MVNTTGGKLVLGILLAGIVLLGYGGLCDLGGSTSSTTTTGSSVTVTASGTVNGVIRSAVTATGMAGVTVRFYNQSNVLITSTTTDVYGAYTATLTAGTYTVQVNATGYINETVTSLTVQGNVTTTVEPVQQVPTSAVATGTMTGIVTDAFTGQGLAGVALQFRIGINTTSGTVAGTATTTSGGAYTVSNINAGNYTVEATLTGYTTLFFTATCVGGQTNANQNASTTPVLPAGQTRIVLSWGETPYDLDSHSTGPVTTSATDRFHVYYASRGSHTSSPYSELDVDDTSSYGPETTTIYQQSTGTYKFYVHDYSNRYSTTSDALSKSLAQVKLYRGSALVATFHVPNIIGTLWAVFELSGDTVTPVNTMTFENDPSVVGGTPSTSGGTTVTGTATGVIRSASTGLPMSGVTVNVYTLAGTLAATYTTDVNGAYTATVTAGAYTIIVVATGYINDTFTGVNITSTAVTIVEPVRQVPTSTTPGTITGIIKDAFSGSGLSGVTLSFRSGLNATSGTVVLTATTTSGGAYTASNLTAGNYTVQAALANYATMFFTATCLGGQTNANQNASITPVLPAGQTRVVLTWGETPYDLDSHMTVPTTTAGTDRFHVYYANRGNSSSSPFVDLDTDDTYSYGPETVTIYQQTSGVYRYYIHDFSNGGSTTSSAMGASGAQVKVYRGSSLIATFNVPNQGGTVWAVFELSGDTVTPVNTMTFESTSNLRSVELPDAIDASLMQNLPRK